MITRNNHGTFLSTWLSYSQALNLDSYAFIYSTNHSLNRWTDVPIVKPTPMIIQPPVKAYFTDDRLPFFIWHTKIDTLDKLQVLYYNGLGLANLELSSHVYPSLTIRATSTSQMNNRGDLIIAWIDKIQQNNEIKYSLKIKRYKNQNNITTRWQPTEEIIQKDVPIYSPQITLDQHGNIVISYILKVSGNTKLEYISYNAQNNKWDGADNLKTPIPINTIKRVKNLKMVANDNGKIVIVWNEKSTSRPSLDSTFVKRLSLFNDRNVSIAPIQLNEHGKISTRPKVAINDDGYAIVVWEQFDAGSSKSSLYYSAFQ